MSESRESRDSKEKGYWGRRASFYLMKDFNCALAFLEVFPKPELILFMITE